MAQEKKTFFVDEYGDPRIGNVILTAVAAILALVLIFGSFKVISAEEVGIPVTLGKVGETPRYGLTMKWPLITHFVKFDKTIQKMVLKDATYTNDIQTSQFEYVFTYRIVSENAPELYLTAGKGYESKLIEPKLHAALKDVIGKYTATKLVDNRAEATAEVEARLKNELSSAFFTDISVEFNNIDYSDEFEKGIEAKVLAEQEAQKSKNRTVQIEEEGRQKVIQAKAEADAAIAAAEGKAKAMDIEGAAIRRNSQYLELKKLDVQAQMAESAKGWQTVIMSGGQANALLNIPSK
ncbi:MAG: prohibitin family protein [Alphaproteobacteria bacterium]|nr:prohibitin family protein [Alphaproteobacteria bacterium]